MSLVTAILETFYVSEFGRLFASYSSSFFHIDSDTAAIFLVSVTLARFGFVPPCICRWYSWYSGSSSPAGSHHSTIATLRASLTARDLLDLSARER
jgi:hypothetical protein